MRHSRSSLCHSWASAATPAAQYRKLTTTGRSQGFLELYERVYDLSVESVFQQLLILMVAIWTAAVLLRRFGLPTIMGELIAGVIVGPAVLGWIEPNEIINVLAQMGIFFLMLHAGVETRPREFFAALRSSWGVAFVGAIVPFSIAMGMGLAFGLSLQAAVFVGLTMTATAMVITIKALQDLGLQDTRFARVIVAACVIDALFTLVLFGLVLSMLGIQELNTIEFVLNLGKVVLFFGVSFAIGYYFYPLFKHPFRHREGKGFTFVLVLALGAGLFAEWMGLHMIIGAYMAGLFFDLEVADPKLIQIVRDRLYGIAYSFLGPIFFISLGFHITFDIFTEYGLWFVLALTVALIIGQVLSAGGMARRLNLSWIESLTVGVGMCGRAEIAFILASLGLSLQAIDNEVFSVLIFTAFLLNIFTPVGLKGCAILLKRKGQGS